jgi:hypothetical protein
MGFQDAETIVSPRGSPSAVACDPRKVLGAESRTLHQIVEAKTECEAETNAQCGTITDQTVVSGTRLPT